jgi:hypothetical protein
MDRKELKNMTRLEVIKQCFGFCIIYGLVLIVIPYYLFRNSSMAIFLTYFANVDIVANNLVINFPSYFSHIYNIKPVSAFDYISYNIISLFALSGIFIYGIYHKNNTNLSDLDILFAMIVMSIITWTLPTNLIPYIFTKIKNKYNIQTDEWDLLITACISLLFILIEFLFLYYSLKYLQKIEKIGFSQTFAF